MSTASSFSGMFRRALVHPERGVAGLVDDLLALCRDHNLEIDWQVDRYCVGPPGGAWEELLDLPLRKSVFRAILARVATLCNERLPGSVSPYGGQGELLVGPNPSVIFQVSFANTADEQRLELRHAKP
jgi:hypothetical protein